MSESVRYTIRHGGRLLGIAVGETDQEAKDRAFEAVKGFARGLLLLGMPGEIVVSRHGHFERNEAVAPPSRTFDDGLRKAAEIARNFGDLYCHDSPCPTCEHIAQSILAELSTAPQPSPTLDWDDLRGAAPDATGDLSSEAFVRKSRDEWDKSSRRPADLKARNAELLEALKRTTDRLGNCARAHGNSEEVIDDMLADARAIIAKAEAEKMIEVTKLTFPNLHAAFVAVEEDNGAHLIGSVYPGKSIDLGCFKVPDYWKDMLPRAEAALLKLRQGGNERFETFCVGEMSEQEAIVGTDIERKIAFRVLTDFFNGWQPEDTP